MLKTSIDEKIFDVEESSYTQNGRVYARSVQETKIEEKLHAEHSSSGFRNTLSTNKESISTHLRQILKYLAPSQPSSVVRLCIQRFIGSSTTMKTKKMFFLADGIYRNNSTRCLSELLEYVSHRFGVVFWSFFGQHLSVSIS
ncbi:hypothetical protein TNCV_3199561 [Trichonephila clavipes]|nr:hypothetical protein TNCV_3199561 [Trichonephila clavipes]